MLCTPVAKAPKEPVPLVPRWLFISGLPIPERSAASQKHSRFPFLVSSSFPHPLPQGKTTTTTTLLFLHRSCPVQYDKKAAHTNTTTQPPPTGRHKGNAATRQTATPDRAEQVQSVRRVLGMHGAAAAAPAPQVPPVGGAEWYGPSAVRLCCQDTKGAGPISPKVAF